MGRLRLLTFLLVAGCTALGEVADTTCTVEIPVSVLLKEGKSESLLRRVSAKQFHITLNGAPVEISTLRPPASPYRFVLVLDHSGSMHPKWWMPTIELAKSFASGLNENAQVGLIVFNDHIEQEAPLQDGRRVLSGLKQLEQLAPNGRTAVFATLEESIKLLEPARPGDIIYLFTDGGDNRSETRFSWLQEQLQRKGIRLFAVLFSESGPVSEDERAGFFQLRELASNSGGDYLTFNSAPTTRHIAKELQKLYGEMVLQFTLEVKEASLTGKRMKFKIDFMDDAFPKAHFKVLQPTFSFGECPLASSR